MMERLTFEGNFCDIAMCDAEPDICGGTCSQREVWERLKHYEDMEEQGRLVVLPCKVGETVFFIDRCTTAEDFGKRYVSFSKVVRMSIDHEFVVLENHMTVRFSGVFLTREEAEQALEGGAENA